MYPKTQNWVHVGAYMYPKTRNRGHNDEAYSGLFRLFEYVGARSFRAFRLFLGVF